MKEKGEEKQIKIICVFAGNSSGSSGSGSNGIGTCCVDDRAESQGFVFR